MEFEKDVEVKGIPAYRFTPPRSVFASKEENPANEGFCLSPKECLGTGLLKVSPCRKGKRLYLHLWNKAPNKGLLLLRFFLLNLFFGASP